MEFLEETQDLSELICHFYCKNTFYCSPQRLCSNLCLNTFIASEFISSWCTTVSLLAFLEHAEIDLLIDSHWTQLYYQE